jgi:hypothetical protein
MAAVPRQQLGGRRPRPDDVRRRPLYYVDDRKPGQILCQGVSLFGGLWLVERADGRVVR